MNDKMSQEDIDNLMNQKDAAEPKEMDSKAENKKETLDTDEIDTVGEVGNIFMGSASTTLAQLLNNKVDITTPTVELFEKIQDSYVIKEDQLIVEIKYTKGLQGTIVLALKKKDSAVLADLMMGGTGKIESSEIGEIQLSAVGEAMNQMVGTASTTLSSMLNTDINISPPEVKLLEKDKPMELNQELLSAPIVAIKFKLIIGDILNTEIIQFMSVAAAKSQVTEVQEMMKSMSEGVRSSMGEKSIIDSLDDFDESEEPMPQHPSPGPTAPPPPPPPQYFQPQPPPQPQAPVTVQPVQFASFDKAPSIYGETNRNLNLVMDVKLELTVELGRTELPIKNVLELTRGSILELEKVAGEPVELFANGKLIARGEVVVIEDNFGLRITSIISPEQRIQEL